MKSIRSHILVGLLPSFCLIFTIAIAGVYFTAKQAEEAELDARLGRLSGSARLVIRNDYDSRGANSRAPGLRSFLSKDEFQSPGQYFELWSQNDETVRRSPNLKIHHLPRPPHYTRDGVKHDATLWNGDQVRINTLQLPQVGNGRPLSFSVAISKAEGQARLNTLLTQVVIGGLACCFVVCLLLVLTLRSALRPLAQVGEQAAAIDACSLSERFSVESLPFEVRPLVVKLNDLMARLEDSFERERRFSGDLAHELRTPLAAIRSTSEVASKWPDQSSIEDFFDISSAAARMQNTVDTLLLLSRLETSSSAQAKEPLNVVFLIQDCLTCYHTEIQERNLKIVTEFDTSFELHTNPQLFRIVVNNLLSNATHYAPSGSEISVVLKDEEPFLCVLNAAPNLTEEDLPHMFDRLWRKDSTRSDGNHSGLGLSLARNCAVAIGLELTAQLHSPSILRMSLFRRKI